MVFIVLQGLWKWEKIFASGWGAEIQRWDGQLVRYSLLNNDHLGCIVSIAYIAFFGCWDILGSCLCVLYRLLWVGGCQSNVRLYLPIPRVCKSVYMHIVFLHCPPSWISNIAFYLSVYSDLESLVCCLRQLCCLCAKFCYPLLGLSWVLSMVLKIALANLRVGAFQTNRQVHCLWITVNGSFISKSQF